MNKKEHPIIEIMDKLRRDGAPDHREGWMPMSTGHNEIRLGKGFYISYNGNHLMRMLNKAEGLPNTGLSSEQPETALVLTKKVAPNKHVQTKFLILAGDHREAYEKLIPKGKKACLKFFEQQSKSHPHFWSDPLK